MTLHHSLVTLHNRQLMVIAAFVIRPGNVGYPYCGFGKILYARVNRLRPCKQLIALIGTQPLDGETCLGLSLLHKVGAEHAPYAK